MKLKCRYCGKSCGNKGGLTIHEAACESNPEDRPDFLEKMDEGLSVGRIWSPYGDLETRQVRCHKCGKEFQVQERENKDKDKYFCSRSCANSRNWSEEDKRKKSKAAKNSEKVRKANLASKGERKKRVELLCPVCLEPFEVRISKLNRTYCSPECLHQDQANGCRYSKSVGGYREGSVRNYRSGRYRDIWCDSSWELAWVVYHLDHQVPFTRCQDYFPYTYKGEKRKYHPDFKFTDEHYVEIKGRETSKDRAKWGHFPHNLEILDGESISPFLEYAKEEYGKEFWENLYSL